MQTKQIDSIRASTPDSQQEFVGATFLACPVCQNVCMDFS